jgi:acetyl-CoA/propionyl-CoA carboxylase biotin carboxyl carrier protein
MVFSSLLIANRGEIAVRIARACADAGIRSVAVYAPEDRDAMHARMADEAFALPGATVAETYLDPAAIVGAARRSGADAVHPGYGFLSESPALARAVGEAGLAWVGPPAEALELVSDKVSARALAARAGVATVPASPGPVADAESIVRFGAEHGYPLVVKACHGGGGRGMRVVWAPGEAAEALAACQREAAAAFGRAECFVERFLERPRHVETQCLADSHGGVAVLSTRDCSVQRRHQKLIEEAPAPFLSGDQTAALASASRALLLAAGYRGAATCEFLIDQDGSAHFMEINPRLQVEHPVTEEVTGVDLVREQLRLAWGEDLGYAEALAQGHAIEFRINCEDPSRGFLPSPGLIGDLRLPGGPGVRCDFGYAAGDALSGSFDSLIGKVVVWGRDRAAALARSRRALRELAVDGVATLTGFHRAVLESPAFAAATADQFAVHTRWVESEFAPVVAGLPAGVDAAGSAPGGLTAAGPPATSRLVVEVGGKRLEVVLPAELGGGVGRGAGAGVDGGGNAGGGSGGNAGGGSGAGTGAGGHASAGGGGAAAAGAGGRPGAGVGGGAAAGTGDRSEPGSPGLGSAPRRSSRKAAGSSVGASADGSITAPMQGTVVRLAVAEGEAVATGDLLVVLEAMKMEQPLTAPKAGLVTALNAALGQRVPTGHVLCVIS